MQGNGIKLYDIQEKTIEKILNNHQFAIFNECGTGKTLCVLEAMRRLREKEDVRFLIVAPLSVLDWWVNEAKKLNMRICKIYGDRKERERVLTYEEGDGFIINYDGLLVIKNHLYSVFESFLKKQNIKVLVLDESTMVKHLNQRFKFLKFLINYIPRRYILTGTPITNSLLDIWTQMYILDKGQRLDTSYYRFRARHFMQVGNFFKWIPLPNTAEVIRDAIKDIQVSYKLSDIRTDEIPDKLLINYIYAHPESKLLTYYNEMKNTMICKIRQQTKDGEEIIKVIAINAGALFTKLLEISSGFVYATNNGEERRLIYISEHKIIEIKILINEVMHPERQIVIFFNFTSEGKLLKQHIPDIRIVDGNTNESDRSEIIESFKNNNFRILGIQSRVGGLGLNLQNASYIIWFSPPLSLEIFQQANSRVFRLGQKQSVVNCYLIHSKLVDTYVYELLEKRENVQKQMMGWLRHEMLRS